MQTITRAWLLSFVVVAGCASAVDPVGDVDDDVLAGNEPLVAIPKVVSEEEQDKRDDALSHRTRSGPNPSGDFYLAVRKNTLSEKWFWSVYLKELQPFGPSPQTLGTRVVRFATQNDKLYVFDADDRRATSDVFSPDLIIDAFPIVKSSTFHKLPGSGGYVLIDPASGGNRFGALGDAFAGGFQPIKIETELSFVQGFKATTDGGNFEQIITAFSDVPIGPIGDVENNDFRLAATVGVSLRRYAETPGFVQVPAPAQDHYFVSDPINVPNTGETKRNAVHWAFAPGMQPIKWVIGPSINDVAADPMLGGADLFGAMKRGIESWNDVFGYPVFTVELATATDSFSDDHVNYVIVDPDKSRGYAYADWRTNPNTGEIRGASVYIGAGFFGPFEDDPADPAPNGISNPMSKTKPMRPALVWQDQKAVPPCTMFAPDKALTGKAKLEAYIQEVITHEIGHTLGLRHNFKGSLVPPTSSVMEYNTAEAAIAQPTPGPYDHDAIKFLYGMSTTLPTQPFCTDDGTLFDPNCVRFDPATATPLTAYQIPLYELVVSLFTDGSIGAALADLYLSFYGTELVGYARAGTDAEATAAWNALVKDIKAPIPAATLASNAAYGPGADAISAWLYKELFLQPNGLITTRISNPTLLTAIANEGKAIILNGDNVRSYATRRTVIDALKRAQHIDSYLALVSAKDGLNAKLPTLSATDQALTRDLIARIDALISPYFE